MINHAKLIFRPLQAARIVGIALTLALSVVARADFASDAQEPLRLLQAKQFDKALVALNKIAPQHQEQFALHYMLGLANRAPAPGTVCASLYARAGTVRPRG